MTTGSSCVSRAETECVADAVASPRDCETLIDDLLTQIDASVLNQVAGGRAHMYML